MLLAGQEPSSLLDSKPVVMAIALTAAFLALGILLLFVIFRSVCASPLLPPVRHSAACSGLECPQVEPEMRQDS